MLVFKEIDKYRDDIVKDLSRIIKCKSVQGTAKPGMPFGKGPKKALECALSISRELGLKAENVDGYAGFAEYGEGEDYVAVLVHLDVVPEGTGWTYDPYEGVIENGKVYGRGASDNKGPAVAAIYSLKVLKDLNVKTKKRVRLIFGTNEESGMAGVDYYLKNQPWPVSGFSPDAGYPAYNREKGIFSIYLEKDTPSLEYTDIDSIKAGSAFNVVPEYCHVKLKKRPDFDLEVLDDISSGEEGNVYYIEEKFGKHIAAKGKPAHGGSPQAGINAVSVMLEFLMKNKPEYKKCGILNFIHEKIGSETNGESLGLKMKDDLSGELTNNLGLLSVDKNKASVGLNVRYPVTYIKEDVLKPLKKAVKDAGFKVNVESHSAPLHVPEDQPLVQKLIAAYEKVTGEKQKPKSMGGGTYARKLKNKGVAFGGSGYNGHQADEHVIIDELMTHAGICTQAIYELIT